MELHFNSIWFATAEKKKRFPKLQESISTEIAIVGGGISGLTCAYLLAKAGKQVTLIEAHQIGTGTTGRSTGNLYATVDQHLSKLQSKWGQQIAREVVKSRIAAIDFIEKVITENKIDCEFERVPFVHFTENLEERAKRFLETESEVAKTLGLNIKLHTKSSAGTLLPFATQGALEILNQAQFHPFLYVLGLSESLPQNVRVFEESPALDIDYKNKTVVCKQGKIKADHIIVATHIPKGVSSLQFRVSPIREHGFAALLKGERHPGIFWSADTPKRSIRTFAGARGNYALVIGEKFKTGHPAKNENENEILNQYLSKRFDLTQERYWWGAQAYRSADLLPLIGERQKNCYCLTGFSTDGLVYGTLGALIISDLILGKKNAWADLYGTKRLTPMKSAPTVIKEGLDNLCQYAKDLPKLGTVSVDEIKRDEGKIVEKKGEKIAVYRDQNNDLHAVSAVCTHMKCIVNFNSAEKTWDCPCHASRFRTDGSILEGPALSPLERRQL